MSPDPTFIKPIVLRNRALHGLCWAAVLLFLVLLVVFMATGPAPDPEPADHIGQAVVNGGAVAMFLRATRLRVVLTNEGLTAYNLLTTHHLTLGRPTGRPQWQGVLALGSMSLGTGSRLR